MSNDETAVSVEETALLLTGGLLSWNLNLLTAT